MKNFFTICFLLFKNYSLLRIYQIIESKKQILNGLSLEFGASENITKNFSNFIQGSSKFEYSNLANFGNKKIIPLNLKKKLKMKSNKYNNILIFNVLEHINNHEIAFIEMKRILSNNGNLIGSTPFLYQVHGAPKDYFRFTKDFFFEKLKKNKFSKVEIKCLGFGPFVACFSLIQSYTKYLPLVNHVIISACYLLDFVLQLFIKTKLNEIYPIGIFFKAKK